MKIELELTNRQHVLELAEKTLMVFTGDDRPSVEEFVMFLEMKVEEIRTKRLIEVI
ncbi:hypothetical protein [Cohnella nanjingensis]|uniref:Uncharacterized protein n=1 Tax=Cohnella nanjingensis TaxID=1387779 RepID=A0A7X0VG17_9BACL|nr:hypothetical protein [Cohnella nanjingensis]MBB6672637.1 hypothetical protein [Cohnella nanjingensis]